ncbi:MAG: hypothetical protein ACSW8B_01445, partial [bacterium]
MDGSTFTENNAFKYDGGAIYTQEDATVTCDGVT